MILCFGLFAWFYCQTSLCPNNTSPTFPTLVPTASPSPLSHSPSLSLSVSLTGSVTWADCQCAWCQLLAALGMWWAALYLRETDASDHLLRGLVWAGRVRNGRRPAGFPFFFTPPFPLPEVRAIQTSLHTHSCIHTYWYTQSEALGPLV